MESGGGDKRGKVRLARRRRSTRRSRCQGTELLKTSFGPAFRPLTAVSAAKVRRCYDLWMSQQVHGHRILELIIDAGGVMPLAQLRSSATSQYGNDAQYYTCSAHGMSFDSLMDFLLRRQKVSIQGEDVTVHVHNMCHDGEEAHSHADAT